MEITGADADFAGPLTVAETVPTLDRPGVSAVVCKAAARAYRVLDVGCCIATEVRLAEHERRVCWEAACDGNSSSTSDPCPRRGSRRG